MPILRAHTITSSLGSAHPSNYRKCETVNSFEVLTIVTKNSILHNLAWFLDLLLVTEKIYLCWRHYAKSVRSRSYTGPHFPAFRLTTERYSVSLRVRLECGKMWTRITPNMDTFDAVRIVSHNYQRNDKILNVTLERSLSAQVSSARWFSTIVWRLLRRREEVKC